ncbi:MAG: hypothetical protein BAJATHORv1_140003 [Candidatus Thorarchaeota archaeon]|nr:MAG: hypothetical protein BAJATHORv1_140003 [Candidatus Thorarchaeota archaeon]
MPSGYSWEGGKGARWSSPSMVWIRSRRNGLCGATSGPMTARRTKHATSTVPKMKDRSRTARVRRCQRVWGFIDAPQDGSPGGQPGHLLLPTYISRTGVRRSNHAWTRSADGVELLVEHPAQAVHGRRANDIGVCQSRIGLTAEAEPVVAPALQPLGELLVAGDEPGLLAAADGHIERHVKLALVLKPPIEPQLLGEQISVVLGIVAADGDEARKRGFVFPSVLEESVHSEIPSVGVADQRPPGGGVCQILLLHQGNQLLGKETVEEVRIPEKVRIPPVPLLVADADQDRLGNGSTVAEPGHDPRDAVALQTPVGAVEIPVGVEEVDNRVPLRTGGFVASRQADVDPVVRVGTLGAEGKGRFRRRYRRGRSRRGGCQGRQRRRRHGHCGSR